MHFQKAFQFKLVICLTTASLYGCSAFPISHSRNGEVQFPTPTEGRSLHNSNVGRTSDWSNYYPDTYRHNNWDMSHNSDWSHYYPGKYSHQNAIPHKDTTKLVPGLTKHADRKGVDKSKDVPKDWKHADNPRGANTDYSKYVPPHYKHVSGSRDPDQSKYVP